MIGLLSLSQLAAVTGGTLVGNDEHFSSVSTDSRAITRGDLFIALKGPNFNGNDYVSSVMEKGAIAALVDEVQPVEIPQVKVADTLKALGALSSYNRDLFGGKVIAVTGSSGKTSVKEMLAVILAEQGSTLSTLGNLNNDIGAPLTLLRIAEHHQYAVIELGASAVGEIAYTASLAKPHVAIITNAASAHLEGFGSYQNIVVAKGEIVTTLSDTGIAVLNADDPAIDAWRSMAGDRKVMTFSLSADKHADVWAESIRLAPASSEFELCWDGGRELVSLPLPGKHNIANALAASCGASALGIQWSRIHSALSGLKGVKGRLEITEVSAGYSVINDTYNANPESTRAAIDVLTTYDGYRVAVLGDMAELGTDAAMLHEQVGLYAKEHGVNELFVCGKYASAVATGFGNGAYSYATKRELLASLIKELRVGARYLVKGSRGSAMEEVVDEMLKQKVVA